MEHLSVLKGGIRRKVREGKALAHAGKGRGVEKRACSLYTAPTSGASITSFTPTNISWDPTCLNPGLQSMSSAGQLSTIDIYLYVASEPVHKWTSQPFSAGTVATQLDPLWWNATSGQPSTSVAQFVFAPQGQPIALTPFATGPSFEVAFDGNVPASATAAAQPAVYTGPSVESAPDSTDSNSGGGGGVTGGRLAAAVIMPILVVLGCLAGYVWWSRRKTSENRKRWSSYVDDRMSVISGATWRDGAPRPSLAHSRAGSVGGMSTRTGMSAPLPPSHLRAGSTLMNDGSVRPTSSLYTGGAASPIRPNFHRAQSSTNSVPRISFAASETSPAKDGNRRSIYNRGYPKMPADAAARSSYYAASITANNSHGSPSSDPFALAPDQSIGPTPIHDSFSTGGVVRGHAAKSSVASSLRHEMIAGSPALDVISGKSQIGAYFEDDKESLSDASMASPQKKTRDTDLVNSPSPSIRALARASQGSFTLPPPPSKAKVMESYMPRAERNSTFSPDDALASYAAKKASSSPALPSPEKDGGGYIHFKGLGKKKSKKSLQS